MVTRYWPRIAAVLVGAIVWAELVGGWMTADSGVDFYLMAWAGATGGLWFLFEKAETALSEESRRSVARRVQAMDFRGTVESIPEHFASLMKHVFGERHLSARCFTRSSVASFGKR
jgi:hypothetical protein